MTNTIETLCIIGIGLIGSSLARAVKKNKLAGRVVICDSDADHLAQAGELGLGDVYEKSAADAVRDADVVAICTPMSAYTEIAKAIAPNLKSGAIVTDVGSVKTPVATDIGAHLPEGVHLIPGHPVAGTEHSGPKAGFAELFEERWCILTPPAGADDTALETVRKLWQGAGMMVEVMDAAHHDMVLAITSHLPHLIAYTIVGTATELEDDLKSEVVKYSASGFRDFTRIAASDPIMWRDIFLNNREAVLDILTRFSEDLTALRKAIRRGDAKTLEDWFTRTRAIRRDVIEMKQA